MREIDRWQNTCPCSNCGWDLLLHLGPCWGVSSVSISQDTSSFPHDFCSSAPCPAVPWPCSPYIVSLDTMGNYNYYFLITFIFLHIFIFRYILSICLYGLCLGSLLYTSKMYCYNSVKSKDFGHVWSMVTSSQSVSCLAGIMITGECIDSCLHVLFMSSSVGRTLKWNFAVVCVSSVPDSLNYHLAPQRNILEHYHVNPLEKNNLKTISGYINTSMSKTGYWFSILSVVLSTSILSLINIEVRNALGTLRIYIRHCIVSVYCCCVYSVIMMIVDMNN